MSTLATMPDTTKLQDETAAIIQQARAITITSGETLTEADELLMSVKTRQKQINEFFDASIKTSHAAWKAALAAKDRLAGPVEEAETLLKGKIKTYRLQEERKRLEEESRLREQARKEAEERHLAEALELERNGNREAAEQVMAAPVMVPPIVVRSSVPKTRGSSLRKVWRFTIENPMLVPREFCSPDDGKIRAHVNANAGRVNIPGVRVEEDANVSARSR